VVGDRRKARIQIKKDDGGREKGGGGGGDWKEETKVEISVVGDRSSGFKGDKLRFRLTA
jgi:hypothetical protein